MHKPTVRPISILCAFAVTGCSTVLGGAPSGTPDGGAIMDSSTSMDMPSVIPDGATILPDGAVILPDGEVLDLMVIVPDAAAGPVMELAGPVGPLNDEDVTPGANPFGVQDYFIDCAGGDDTNNGLTAATPWRTIHHFNSEASGALQPGARVFFKRGGVCRGDGESNRYGGTIWINPAGTAERNIEYKAYGSGAAPIISGAISATGWTVESGNIYHTNIGPGRPVMYLYIGNNVQTLAREPDVSADGTTQFFLTDHMNGNGDGTSYITDSEMPTGVNLVGGRAFYRHSNWAYAQMPIVGHSGTTITMSTPVEQCYRPDPSCPDSWYPEAGWAYLVENDRELLDHAGEWYYDSSTGDLSFWAPGDADPNTLTVDVVVDHHAFYFADAHHHITIANLVLEKYIAPIVEIGDAPSVPGDASNITIRNCELRYAFVGLKIGTSGSDFTHGNNFLNNHLHDVYNLGIYSGGNGHRYHGNRIENIALEPWLGGDQTLWGYFALNNVSGAPTFTSNILRKIGYSGINHIGGGEFSGNLIEDISQTLNDGCAICTEPVTGALVRRNIVRGAHGYLEGTPLDFINRHAISSGISTGDHDDLDGIIEENVVSDFANGGITLDNNFNSRRHIVRNNTVYTTDPGDGHGAAGLQFYDQSVGVRGTCTAAGYGCFVENFEHQVYSNRVYMLHPQTRSMNFVHLLTDGMGNNIDYGTFWDNYLFQADRLTMIAERRAWGGIHLGDIGAVLPEPTATLRATASSDAAEAGLVATGTHCTLLEGHNDGTGSLQWWRVSCDGGGMGWLRDYEMGLAEKNVAEWEAYAHEPPAGHESTPNRSNGYIVEDPADYPPLYVNDTGVPTLFTIGAGRCDSNGNALPETMVLEHFADAVVPERCADQPH